MSISDKSWEGIQKLIDESIEKLRDDIMEMMNSRWMLNALRQRRG